MNVWLRFGRMEWGKAHADSKGDARNLLYVKILKMQAKQRERDAEQYAKEMERKYISALLKKMIWATSYFLFNWFFLIIINLHSTIFTANTYYIFTFGTV